MEEATRDPERPIGQLAKPKYLKPELQLPISFFGYTKMGGCLFQTVIFFVTTKRFRSDSNDQKTCKYYQKTVANLKIKMSIST
jgi:hypothetical protein